MLRRFDRSVPIGEKRSAAEHFARSGTPAGIRPRKSAAGLFFHPGRDRRGPRLRRFLVLALVHIQKLLAISIGESGSAPKMRKHEKKRNGTNCATHGLSDPTRRRSDPALPS